MSIYEKLLKIQLGLKAPKNQYNDFGKYNYRTCEDILNSLKDYLKENNLIILLSDELIYQGNRYYIKATATLIDVENGEKISNTALAREDDTKSKFDDSQLTGSASSYARKYALNGMFAIDDVKDSDFTNNGQEQKEYKLKEYKPKEYKCKQCGNKIKGYTKPDGTKVTPEMLYNSTGICVSCYKKQNAK